MTGALHFLVRVPDRRLGAVLTRMLTFSRLQEEVFFPALHPDTADVGVDALRHFVFVRGCKPYSSEQFSELLGRMTEKYFGSKLTIHSWRHAAIGMAKVYQLDAIENQPNPLDFLSTQSGHVALTSTLIYAIADNQLGTCDAREVAKARQTGDFWHVHFLGLDSCRGPGKRPLTVSQMLSDPYAIISDTTSVPFSLDEAKFRAIIKEELATTVSSALVDGITKGMAQVRLDVDQRYSLSVQPPGSRLLAPSLKPLMVGFSLLY